MLVSTVIPAYNAEKHIAETIESVYAQSYSPIEIIVVDDGSCDGTAALVKSRFPNVIYIYQANAGAAAARNTGIQHARGEYVAILDSDDLWFPGKIASQIELMTKTGFVWCYCDCLYFREDMRNILYRLSALSRPHSGTILEPLLLENFISCPTPIFRRDAIMETGLFDEKISHIAADWNMWLRLAARYPVAYVEEALSAYRLHGESMMSISTIAQILDANLDVLEKGLASMRERNGRIAAKARANIYFKTGLIYLKRGDMSNGRRMIFLALRTDPLQFRLYTYQTISLMPSSVVRVANVFRQWYFRTSKATPRPAERI